MRGLPLLARLDGRAFHTFTRDLQRPYEPGMSVAMIETTRYAVAKRLVPPAEAEGFDERFEVRLVDGRFTVVALGAAS